MKKYQSIMTAGLLLASTVTIAAQAENFDLDTLIEAARKEAPITIYDSTGKIVDMANAFSAKYGVQATGQKVSANSQLEMLIREHQAKNIRADVALLSDTPAGMAQLLPAKIMESWVPSHMAETIPQHYRDPFTMSVNANLWSYNGDIYEKCPVNNIWELTDPKWQRKVALVDPLTKGTAADWFNQTETYGEEQMRAAYEAQFGHKFEPKEFATATQAWVAGFAQNAPLLTASSDPVSEAVGTPGDPDPFFGLVDSAKFRNNEDKGLRLKVCETLTPWVGWTYTKLALISSETKSPNMAKLFIQYLLTEEGLLPQMEDGKMPTSSAIPFPKDEPSGLINFTDKLLPYNAASGLDDWEKRQDWQDVWRINYRR